MYHIVKTDGTSVTLSEEVRYIRENLSTGAFVEADELTAQGVAVNGTPYNLVGRTPLRGVADTVNIASLTAEEAEKAHAKAERDQEIAECKDYLTRTDYIVLKLAEAQTDGDLDEVAQLQALYAPELVKRRAMRARINDLQAEDELAE